jgi:rod shape-determining protein MreD
VRRSLLFWLVVALLPPAHFLVQVGFGMGRFAPDLLVIALLLVARELRTSRAAAVGFVFGILEDAFSILAFGANALTLTLLAVAGSRTRDLFVGESAAFFLGYLALGTWLRYALHWFVAGEEVRGSATQVLLVEAPVGCPVRRRCRGSPPARHGRPRPRTHLNRLHP